MGNPNWVEKLNESIVYFTDESVREFVMEGSEGFPSLNEKEKTLWVKEALDKLDSMVPDKDTRYEIMTNCSCDCADNLIGKFREEYQKNNDIDSLLDKMYKNPFYIRPRRVGDIIYFVKVACNKEKFDQATNLEEKRYHYCHCDYIKAVNLPISPTHCFCSAGWYKRIWKGILERPIKVEMVKSIMQGDDKCEFAVYLQD